MQWKGHEEEANEKIGEKLLAQGRAEGVARVLLNGMDAADRTRLMNELLESQVNS